MKEKLPDINCPKRTTLLSALALCLLLFSVAQCGRYTEQLRALTSENEALSASLTDNSRLLNDRAQQTEDLQTQLTEAASIVESRTESGFIKKGGVYLIDDISQLRTLQRLIGKAMEIEPGVSAASASYRLRNDLDINDYYEICLGTEESPFCGSFDGDGHRLEGSFPLMDGANVPEAIFYTDTAANIDNLYVTNHMSHYDTLKAPSDCEEVERHLADCTNCRMRAEISAWDLDVRETAKALRTYWERNAETDGACVSMTFWPNPEEKSDDAEKYLPNLHTALTTLAGAEYAEIIENAQIQETGYLWFIRLERIGELTCCTFEISEPAYGPNNYGRTDDSYYIIVEGNLDGEEIRRQCLHIPYTEMEMHSIGINSGYRLEKVDLDFDGKSDLLIHEGSSGGSGGSWSNYRALVWRNDTGQFSYFPSFPEQVVSLEFDRQRVVNHWRSGISCECVQVYGIVNGEYACTRKLLLESKLRDGDRVTELSYYEMDELVETHILSDWYDCETLYPDMDYWSKG